MPLKIWIFYPLMNPVGKYVHKQNRCKEIGDNKHWSLPGVQRRATCASTWRCLMNNYCSNAPMSFSIAVS